MKRMSTNPEAPSTSATQTNNIDLSVANGLSGANSPNSLDGLWRSDGYGYVLEIDGSNTTLYEETTMGCLPVPTPVQIVNLTSQDTAQLTLPGRVGFITLNRIDRLPETCRDTPKTDPVAAFDLFATTFAEHYPFFENRNVDWPSVTPSHRVRVSASTTDDQLANIFADMVRPLGDAHTSVAVGGSAVFQGARPGSAVAGYEEFGPFLERVMASTARYLGVELETWGNGLIAYADLPDGIGYLRVTAFDGFSDSGRINDEQAELTKALDEVLSNDRVAKLHGVIIDLRVNGGGSDELALQLAGHFTDVAYRAYSKQARNDSVDPKKFTRPQPITVQPSSGNRFTGPLVLLTASLTVSAGEGFTQAMLNRQTPPIRIGGNTQGVFSDVLQRNLPGCTVTFALPNEDFITENGVSFDRLGIPPDICIPTLSETELAEGKDLAMDTARQLILSAEAVNRADLTKPGSSIC